MANDDDNYKRLEDKKWRDGVNDRIASLTSGEIVQNDRLDKLGRTLELIRCLLEGQPGDKDDSGIKGDLKDLAISMNRINTVLSLDITGNPGYDPTGKPGYLRKIELLWNQEDRLDRRADRWWRGVVPIIVAVVSLTGLLLTNLDRIAGVFRDDSRTALEHLTDRTEKQSGHKRHRLPASRQAIPINGGPDERTTEGVP